MFLFDGFRYLQSQLICGQDTWKSSLHEFITFAIVYVENSIDNETGITGIGMVVPVVQMTDSSGSRGDRGHGIWYLNGNGYKHGCNCMISLKA